MKAVSIFIALIFMFPMALAQEKSCFPVGSARHDRECYDFDNQSDCQKPDDIYSCGWGKRKENPPSDDDVLICEDHRCKDAIDDEEDFDKEP